MLISVGNASCRQQALISCPQSAIATSDAPVFVGIFGFLATLWRACGQRLPSCSIAERTNIGLSRDRHRPLINSYCSYLTLHPGQHLSQVGNLESLCTSCEAAGDSVDERGEICGEWLAVRLLTREVERVLPPKPALKASGADTVVQNRLPMRIFTVDILSRERKIRFRQVSHSVQRGPNSRLVLGMKETCEEKL